ncbi:hypothetical protein U9M48_031704 [Paspalum notatum var. saurae]|uniref:Uncharacterized protein n=1 Tax=Paspalum notatum var. saurae TaxID=547442 RepID=A0AAQ3U4H8_PASNO
MELKVTLSHLGTQVLRVTNHQGLLKVSPSSKLKNKRGEEVKRCSRFRSQVLARSTRIFDDLEAQEWREVWRRECSFKICLEVSGGRRSTLERGVKGYLYGPPRNNRYSASLYKIG